jgi:hypothetical protein
LNKDELQDLINYGASEIFKSTDGTFTEQDIDALLLRGEERSKLQKEAIDSNLD